MSNDVLNNLLKEYEQKKMKAEIEAENKKEILYDKIPRLRKIDNEINSYAILVTKNILNKNNESLSDFSSKMQSLKQEKENILRKNNIDVSYLKPSYSCNLCNDTGYIQKDNYRSEMCSCLKQKLLDISFNKSNMSNLNVENFANFNENLFSDEPNASKYKFNISPRENIKKIRDKSIEFVKNFDNPDYKNLLFTGNTGLGKTFLSNCIANEVLKMGKTVLYQTAPVLLENIIDFKLSKQKYNSENINKSVLEADLLIIDDLGTESLNSMKLSELFTIINTRILNLNHKITKTIISTNLNINEIFSKYEERIGSRIAGYYDIYCFFGDDIRFKNR